MAEKKKTDINALGQAIDSTWGRSSTPKTASYSVKMTMQGIDRLLVSYQAIINFASEVHMIQSKRSASEESERVVTEVIKHLKANYKELSGQTITLKEVNSDDSLEIIGFAVHNPKRTALFRKKVLFEIG
jgi:hypothetical protein